MKKITLFPTMLFVLIALQFSSCTKNKLESTDVDCATVTYSNTIKPIIAANCLTSGCHDGSAGIGNFSTYAGLQPVLSNGLFKTKVLTDKTMPKGGSLTEQQIQQITCWVNAGAVEN